MLNHHLTFSCPSVSQTILDFETKYDNVYLMDIRPLSSYLNGHIKGAINQPIFTLEDEASLNSVVGNMPKDKVQMGVASGGVETV